MRPIPRQGLYCSLCFLWWLCPGKSRETAGVRDKDVLKEKYYINKTLKAPRPMRFSSPVTSDFPLVFPPSSQHQPGLTDRPSPGSRFSHGLALTKQHAGGLCGEH